MLTDCERFEKTQNREEFKTRNSSYQKFKRVGPFFGPTLLTFCLSENQYRNADNETVDAEIAKITFGHNVHKPF